MIGLARNLRLLDRGVLLLLWGLALPSCELIIDTGQYTWPETVADGGGGVIPPGQCGRVSGALEENAFLVGTLFPVTGESAESRGLPRENAVIMAMEEINALGGIQGRRIQLIHCDSAGGDSSDNSDVAIEAAGMLVERGVTAIVGPTSSTAVMSVAQVVTIPWGVLLVTPSGSSPSITAMADNGLVWRTTASDAYQGKIMAQIAADRALSRVAMAYNEGAYGSGLFDTFYESFAGEVEAVPYPEAGEDLSGVVTSLVAKGSLDGVVLASLSVEALAILQQAQGQSFFPPLWILSDGGRSTSVYDAIGGDPQIVDHLIGTGPAPPSGMVYELFQIQYSSKFGVEPGTYTAQSYDALYILALALAAQNGDSSAPALAQGLCRLSAPEGTLVELGRDEDFMLAISELQQGGSVNVYGASGPLDFDSATGEPTAPVEEWDFGPGGEIRQIQVYTPETP